MNDFLTNLNDEVQEANFLRYSLNTNIPTEACQCQQKPLIKQKYFVIISVFRIKIDFNVCVKRLLIELLIENNLLNNAKVFS